MSFFRYPGGKAKLFSQIEKKILKHNVEYREPFFGGGSVGVKLFQKSMFSKIWINDKDIGVSCLWSSVILHPEELKCLVINFKPTVTDFYKFKENLISIKTFPKDKAELINYAFMKLVIHQISYSGLGTKSGGPLGGKDQKSKYKIDCRWSPQYICKKIDKLHKMFSQLSIRNNFCTQLDFENIINDNSCDAVLYLDPPYYIKGNELYECGFDDNDHIRLSNCLKQTNHKWVLSYDNCDFIVNLYKWAKIEIIKDVNYSITAKKDKKTGKASSIKKEELLITNV